MGCERFIHFAAKALFEKEVKDKIKRANFITVLAGFYLTSCTTQVLKICLEVYQ